MNKVQMYVFTFMCYTSVHALRTAYSYAKKDIASAIQTDLKYMGIVDSLMLIFLGLGHFLHAIRPIKRPVRSLWIGMLACSINYASIPALMQIQGLGNIYILSLLMCINGFLQSYTWPNLLMIINSKFTSDTHPTLLGFWSTNTNVGNIVGYAIFQLLMLSGSHENWDIGLWIAAAYALLNGVIIKQRFVELEIESYRDASTNKSVASSQGYRFQNMLPGDNVVLENLQGNQAKVPRDLVETDLQENLIPRRSNRIVKVLSIKAVPKVQEPSNSSKLSVLQVFKDVNVSLLTITFALTKSVIYGIMLWVIIFLLQLPLYFRSKADLVQYSTKIPITYDIAAIFGSVTIGFLFKKIINKGILMIPFMLVLVFCFFLLKYSETSVFGYFTQIAVVGFCLGGIFNTLSSLVVMQLTKVIPENLRTSSLGFFSALTMAVGNFATAFTQILIGFVIGKQNQQSIFLVFLIYTLISLLCLVWIAVISHNQQRSIQAAAMPAIEQRQNDRINYSEFGGQEWGVRGGAEASLGKRWEIKI